MPKRMSQKLVKEYADHSFAYESFHPDGQLHIVCPHCRAAILLSENLSPTVKREIAELDYRFSPESMERLVREAGCEHIQAKAILMHLRDAESRCHNCRSVLRAGSLLCAQCMAVNLDW